MSTFVNNLCPCERAVRSKYPAYRAAWAALPQATNASAKRRCQPFILVPSFLELSKFLQLK